MAEERVQRRLAAILAADVVGYSRMMEADEGGTLAALMARRREVLEPTVAKHQGQIFKVTGDGWLIEFASAVNAVQCAVNLQEGMTAANSGISEDRNIILRIGINLGDVMVEGGDLYGDGVNIAARLEAMAEPGGILVSGTAHAHIKNNIKAGFEDLGFLTLKNIAEPVRAYRVGLGTGIPKGKPSITLPGKPSIAVLPFQNMSGEPEQEYFADGIVEEIITALSRMKWLFVIARNSSFSDKNRNVDVKQVGRELGVRYVLEGSVRKAARRIRITGQLIDAGTGAHLWADRFEGELEDIFVLQDRVTTSVVGAISPKLEQAEIERAKRKPTESLDAYDYYMRGQAALNHWTLEGNNEALAMFTRATEIDPQFAAAFGMVARCYSQRKAAGWMIDPAHEIAETRRVAWRAAELGRDDAVALCTAGFALARVVGDLENGVALIDRAIALNPNLAWAWYFSGWVKVWLGEPEVAIERATHALRLSPYDPYVFNMQSALAHAHFIAGRDAEASSWAEMALRERQNHHSSLGILAASCALTGRHEKARNAMTRLREIDPALRISNLGNTTSLHRPDDLARLADGLRKAGLPE